MGAQPAANARCVEAKGRPIQPYILVLGSFEDPVEVFTVVNGCPTKQSNMQTALIYVTMVHWNFDMKYSKIAQPFYQLVELAILNFHRPSIEPKYEGVQKVLESVENHPIGGRVAGESSSSEEDGGEGGAGHEQVVMGKRTQLKAGNSSFSSPTEPQQAGNEYGPPTNEIDDNGAWASGNERPADDGGNGSVASGDEQPADVGGNGSVASGDEQPADVGGNGAVASGDEQPADVGGNGAVASGDERRSEDGSSVAVESAGEDAGNGAVASAGEDAGNGAVAKSQKRLEEVQKITGDKSSGLEDSSVDSSDSLPDASDSDVDDAQFTNPRFPAANASAIRMGVKRVLQCGGDGGVEEPAFYGSGGATMPIDSSFGEHSGGAGVLSSGAGVLSGGAGGEPNPKCSRKTRRVASKKMTVPKFTRGGGAKVQRGRGRGGK